MYKVLGKIKYRWKRLKKNHYIMLIGIMSLFLIVGGFSYALFTSNTEGRGSLNIVTGEIVATIESESLDRNYRITIKSGESKEIVITLKNENERDAKFNFWYEAGNGVYVYNDSYNSENGIVPDENGMIIEKDESRIYSLTITNTTNSEQEVTFGSTGGLYNKELSFPSDKRRIEVLEPILDENMIRVIYNETTSTWEKAGSKNWYDYKNGKWANAVTVTSASRSKYQRAASGTAIPMSDIETMWVWIPRYSYTIGSEDGANYYGKKGEYLSSAPTQALPGEIDIRFIPKSAKETGSGQYKVVEGVNNWRTSDGFTLGNEELSGIWVGKFETSSSSPTATNGGGNVTNLDAMIKPNVISWRGIQVANIAEVARNMTKSRNRYGFNADRLNSHAMKNSEWALVAYLSQSKYGKLGNKDYSGVNKEIYQNKSDQFITGCSYGTPSNGNTDYGCQYTYEKSPSGTGASTTGTIYGIYDMVGGAWEYVMGNYAPNGSKHSGMSISYNSGYTGLLQDGTTFIGKSWLEDKYYDFYSSSNPLTACNGTSCISQALNETAGWYEDYAYMIGLQSPWIIRSGYYGHNNTSGIFYYYYYEGNETLSGSFRLILGNS